MTKATKTIENKRNRHRANYNSSIHERETRQTETQTNTKADTKTNTKTVIDWRASDSLEYNIVCCLAFQVNHNGSLRKPNAHKQWVATILVLYAASASAAAAADKDNADAVSILWDTDGPVLFASLCLLLSFSIYLSLSVHLFLSIHLMFLLLSVSHLSASLTSSCSFCHSVPLSLAHAFYVFCGCYSH